MVTNIDDGLKQLSSAQRTLFIALKRRFGAKLGLNDSLLLYAVRRMFVPPPYAAKKSILRAGEIFDLFAVLAAGTVKVTCTNEKGSVVALQMVGAGDVFGLPSLARKPEARRLGAVAHSQSLIGLITADTLHDVIERLDTKRRLRILTYGWNASIGLLLEKRLLLSLSAEERVWHALGRLALRFPAPAREPGTIGIPLTQTDIGQLVGATRPTVCRKLKALGKEVISQRRGRYVVHRQPPFAAGTDFRVRAPSASSALDDDGTRKDAVQRLQRQTLRMGLPPSAVRAFVQHARLVICSPGAQIALPDRSAALALLISGAARIECPDPEGQPLTLLFSKPGWLIVGGTPAPGRAGFRAVAHVESCAAILTHDGLARVVEAMSAAEFLRFVALGWRVFSHHSWQACLALMMSEKERILHLLTQLAIDFPAAHDAGTIIDFPLTRADIGRVVAANECSVGRCLVELERERRIAFADGPIKRIVVVGLNSNPRVA